MANENVMEPVEGAVLAVVGGGEPIENEDMIAFQRLDTSRSSTQLLVKTNHAACTKTPPRSKTPCPEQTMPYGQVHYIDERTKVLGRMAELEELRNRNDLKRKKAAFNSESPLSASLASFFLQQKQVKQDVKQKRHGALSSLSEYRLKDSFMILPTTPRSAKRNGASFRLGVGIPSAYSTMADIDYFFRKQHQMDKEWREKKEITLSRLHMYRQAQVNDNSASEGGKSDVECIMDSLKGEEGTNDIQPGLDASIPFNREYEVFNCLLLVHAELMQLFRTGSTSGQDNGNEISTGQFYDGDIVDNVQEALDLEDAPSHVEIDYAGELPWHSLPSTPEEETVSDSQVGPFSRQLAVTDETGEFGSSTFIGNDIVSLQGLPTRLIVDDALEDANIGDGPNNVPESQLSKISDDNHDVQPGPSRAVRATIEETFGHQQEPCVEAVGDAALVEPEEICEYEFQPDLEIWAVAPGSNESIQQVEVPRPSMANPVVCAEKEKEELDVCIDWMDVRGSKLFDPFSEPRESLEHHDQRTHCCLDTAKKTYGLGLFEAKCLPPEIVNNDTRMYYASSVPASSPMPTDGDSVSSMGSSIEEGSVQFGSLIRQTSASSWSSFWQQDLNPKPEAKECYEKAMICNEEQYLPNLHATRGPCDRCLSLASEEERAKFRATGRHLHIMIIRGGCRRSCTAFPRDDYEPPVRLCRKCYFDTHRAAKLH